MTATVRPLLVTLVLSFGCTPAPPGDVAITPEASAKRVPTASPTRGVARDPEGIEVAIDKVIDGDTLLVRGLEPESVLVRLIGINAPETGKGRTIRECFGAESARWLAEQVPRGAKVRLVYDVGPRDRFGRRLAYVYRADGTFVNAALIANGYAQTMTIPPNVRHAKELRSLQAAAIREGRGLWRACRSGSP